MGEMTENDGYDDISMIADNLFKEHKVEQLLYKYFVKGDNEKRVQKTINEEKQRKISQKNKFIVSEIKRLSESVSQEVSARKLIQQYPKLRFVGKSNKNNLVFENSSLNQFKVTPNGKLI
jgi:signal-transduction protein with cAMP-binding, CBS, and nucleotidyltransferase domain